MARVTVEDCLHAVENRFELVILATRRARSLINTGKDPLVAPENDKPTVIALREIADGHVTRELLDQMDAEAAAEERFEEVRQDQEEDLGPAS